MPTTPIYGLPYQSLTDPPDGPNLGEDLALAVEDELARIDGDVSAVPASVLTTVNGRYGTPAAPISTGSNGIVTAGTTETPDTNLGILTFTALAGVRYKVSLGGRALSMTVANDRFNVKLRYTTNGVNPTIADTLLERDSTIVNGTTGGTGGISVMHVVQFMPGAGTIKIISTWQRSSGTGVATPIGLCSMWAEAIGTV